MDLAPEPECDEPERRPGISGRKLSRLGLGCNNFGLRCSVDDSLSIIDAALDCGVNFFDTADIYGDGESEAVLGKGLGAHRDNVVVATKFGRGKEMRLEPHTIAHVAAWSCDQSLRRLGMDQIDLFQLHRWPSDLPADRVIDALEQLKSRGKIKSYGCSDPDSAQLEAARVAAERLGASGFATVQIERSLLAFKSGNLLRTQILSYKMTMLPYYPLAGGLLSGKYRSSSGIQTGLRLAEAKFRHRFDKPENWIMLKRLEQLAEEEGCRVLDLSIAWLLSDTAVSTVMAGARTTTQVSDNSKAAAYKLSGRALSALAEIHT
jgi:aryl-alcohol dehydrogenase-like predicted oxidoreductase